LFASLKGKEGKRFGRKKRRMEQVEEIDDIENGRLSGFIFLHNTKFFLFGGTQIVLEESFWRF